MSLTEEYWAAKKKKKKEEEEKSSPKMSAPLYVNKTAPLYNSDIAPVRTTGKKTAKKTDKKDERKWFQKGAFEDGYDFGDVTKTLLGTHTDLREDVVGGVLGMGEAVADAGAFIAGGVGKLFGADEFADKMQKFAAKDLYDEEKIAKKIVTGPGDWFGVDAEENSVLGDKSDSLLQSGGQLAATAALQYFGVPWQLTMGVTSFGTEVENAFRNGATYEEALFSGATSAGAEILMGSIAKIPGISASGSGKLSGSLIQKLTKNMSSTTVKNLINWGVNLGGEGVEEPLTSFFQRLGQVLSYERESTLKELAENEEARNNYLSQVADKLFGKEAREEYGEAFIGGVALAGLAGAPSTISANRKGININTGLTTTEQKVADKVFEDRVAEAEKDGKKLSQNEKSKIFDEVLRAMERGDISTDTIEEVLGGDTYKTYRETVDSEDAIRNEYEELGNKQNPTLAEQTRYAELHEQIKGMDNTARDNLRSQLDEEMSGIVNGSRLAESYIQKGERSRAFEADVSKYDEKQRATIQSAIDSKILNNTRRTHEFVDMIAKISADKGVPFNFADNAKLKETGFAVDGKTVNGFVTKDGVTLNINSAKALDTVVGHEVTHVLEGTEFYDALQKTVFEYAKTKGEYDSRLANLTELYKNIKDADVNKELTADLVGDYLFSDTDFINHLSVNNRNVFEKIYDEVKYLCKVATAGSKEARELEKVKRAFEKAYKADGKTEGTKYSITEIVDENNKSYGMGVRLDSTLLDNLTPDERKVMVKERIKELGGESFTAYDNNGNAVDVTIAKPNAYFKNQNGKKRLVNHDLTEKYIGNEVKQEAVVLIDELITTSKFQGTDPAKHKHGWLDNNGQNDWDVWTTYIQDKNNTIWEATLHIANTANGEKIIYDVVPTKKVGQSRNLDTSPPDTNVAQKKPPVKQQFSVSDAERVFYTPKGVEVVQNPTNSEYRNMREEIYKEYPHLRGTGEAILRHTYDESGNEYYWNAFDGMHMDVEPYINKRYNTRTSQQWEWWTRDDKDEYPTDYSSVRYSVSDNSGKTLTKGQQEYFKDSKMRDDNGNLMVMYHGSPNKFTTFRQGTADGWGTGIYFTNNRAEAENYGDNIVEAYLNIANPFNADTMSYYDIGAEDTKAYIEYDKELWKNRYSEYDTYEEYKADGMGADMHDIYENDVETFNKILRELGYDGIIADGSNGIDGLEVVAFSENQAKLTTNENPTADKDIRYSLSRPGETSQYGKYHGKDMQLAPVAGKATVAENETVAETPTTPVQDIAPIDESLLADEGNAYSAETLGELARMEEEGAEWERRFTEAANDGDYVKFQEMLDSPEYKAYEARLAELRKQTAIAPEEAEYQSDRLASLDDSAVPPETDAPYTETNPVTADDPFAARDIYEVGNRKVKAYMYENPEVKPFFQREANAMLGELGSTTRGERWYNGDLYYSSGGEFGWGGTKRHTSDDIAYLLDECGYTYDQIEKGLNAIIEDNGKENNACSKRIEFLLHDRLKKGYKDFVSGYNVPPNQDYINLLNEKQISEYSKEAFDRLMENADDYAPALEQPTAPVSNPIAEPIADAPADISPVKQTATQTPPPKKPPVNNDKTDGVQPEKPKTAQIVYGAKEQPKKQSGLKWADEHIFRKGAAIEDLALKTGNREVYARFDNIRRAENAAQYFIANGADGVPALQGIYDGLEEIGKRKAFDYYLAHMLNVDRMSLETPENRAIRESLAEKFKGYSDKQLEAIAMEWIDENTSEDAAKRIKDARAYIDSLKGKNKPVFGDEWTADRSRAAADLILKQNPEIKPYVDDMYAIAKHLREAMVESGLIDRKTADMLEKKYPHYVPIHRTGKDGLAVNVPLDSNKTGVNNPIKKATGGNSDFYTFADTMAERIEQTYRAIAKNRFGVELKNTLGTVVEEEAAANGADANTILPAGTKVKAHDRENIGEIVSYDESTEKYTVHFKNNKGQTATVKLYKNIVSPLKPVKQAATDMDSLLDSLEDGEELLQKGKNGQAATFTVFENGKRVKFAITDDIYEALKPSNFTYNNKALNIANEVRKGLVTTWSPKFAVNNPIKDTGDVVLNSQHPVRTYANYPAAIKSLITKDQYYKERMSHGGSNDSVFNRETKTFDETKLAKAVKDNKFLQKVGLPFRGWVKAQEFMEQVPRMAEYIASRKMGRSIDVSMLDSGQVTTNFGATGDLTNMLNRNGFTFLGASIEGFNQQIRNIRQAKYEGAKGWAKLAGKYIAAGLPALLLNHLMWDDDEEYEELSDYIKANYYIVAKTDEGKFIRLPKPRVAACVQEAFKQMENLVTGNDEVDFDIFADLVVTNIAPANPAESNLAAPLWQTFVTGKTWYGDDMIPTRLKDLPAGEQYDDSTDEFSKWLGRTFDISPIKANYLLDQYSGVIGDIALPMMTPKAESRDDSFIGKMIAPVRDAFVTDSVLKNQNVSDFYEKSDELTKNAKSMYATDEDILKSKYMGSVNAEMGKLYGEKREIQSSTMPNGKKYEAVRDIQKQINELAKDGLATHEDVRINGKLATVGDRHYHINKDGEWEKTTDAQLAKYNFLDDNGVSYDDYYKSDKDTKEKYDSIYSWYKEASEEAPGKIALGKAVSSNIVEYRTYASDLNDIRADKDENGDSISGSAKEKKLDYINSLDLDYGQKIILYRSLYDGAKDKDKYNGEILDYLNSRDDLTYEDRVAILRELDFDVDEDGYATW